MWYKIFLENLLLEVVIGILPFEREKRQKIRIDGEFVYFKNNEDEFLDYRDLRGFLSEAFMQEFGLLEEALEFFAKEIPKNFPQIKKYRLKVTKLEIFGDCQVALEISQ